MNSSDDSRQSLSAVSAPRRGIISLCLIIFLFTLGVRLIVWQYNGAAAAQVMTGLTDKYKEDARTLLRGEVKLFVRGANPPADANVLAHPPGYSILVATLYALFGETDAVLRLFQLLCDAASAVLVFLIALELLSRRVAVIAGILAALSPQLAYNSLLLLPDSLSVLLILLALYLLLRGVKKHGRWPHMLAAGALLGLSCWLRPNGLLLPLYLAALTCYLLPRGRRLRGAALLLGAFILLIAPLTVRNLVVFKKFIPLSLGSGVTMIEGIAEYDREGVTKLPATDMDVLSWEAREYQRPDYAGSLYNPDGVERERARNARGLAVIRARPFWFFGVMTRRAASMLRMERVPVIAGSATTLDAGTQPSGASKLLSFPAILLKAVQKIFLTAIMLPLCLLGIFLLARQRDKLALSVLLVVPVYYLSVQSLLHTEYRYVIALQYFFLVFVAFALYRAFLFLCAFAPLRELLLPQRRKGAKGKS